MQFMKRAVQIVAGVGVALIAFQLFWSPVPADYTPYFEENTPRNISTMRTTAADLDARLEPGQQLFTVRANYYAGSHIDHAWTSRVWIVVNKHNVGKFSADSPQYQRIHHGLTQKFRSGEIGVVVMTPRTGEMVQEWNDTERVFHNHYCRVTPRPAVYDRLDTHIYEYHQSPPKSCNSTIGVEWHGGD